MEIYPYKCRPIYKERIWGGSKLREVFAKPAPADATIGESWELADLPDDKTRIDNGPLKDRLLSEVIREYGPAVTGSLSIDDPFPLLVKILDAEDVLSVQVHPDASACEKMGKGKPKTECWYILEAEPGACIYKGFKPGTTPEDFKNAIENGTTADCLDKIPVKKGECHFLASGTPHAIGPGLLIAEIQQPSDTTYRVFDWNRVDQKTGKGRELHIEEALQSVNYEATADKLSVTVTGRLVDAPEFRVDKYTSEIEPPVAGTMQVCVFTEGSGSFQSAQSEDVPFQRGDTFLIPAQWQGEITWDNPGEYLIATV